MLQWVHGGYNKSHMVELSMTFELPEYSMQLYEYNYIHVYIYIIKYNSRSMNSPHP